MNIDWPQRVAEEWLFFERQSGTLEEVLKCVEKTKSLKTQTQQVQEQNVKNAKADPEVKIEEKQKRRRYEEEERSERLKKGW